MAFRRPLVIKGDALHEMSDSDILALQSSVDVRNVQLSILKSDGSLVKRIFGFSDSGD